MYAKAPQKAFKKLTAVLNRAYEFVYFRVNVPSCIYKALTGTPLRSPSLRGKN